MNPDNQFGDGSRFLLSGTKPASGRVMFALICLLLFWFTASLSWGADLSERTVVLRYFCFVLSGFFAFAVPHLRFPDPSRHIIQSMNLTPEGLFSYTLRTFMPVFLLLSGCIFLIAFLDFNSPFTNIPGKLSLFLSGMIFTVAVGLASIIWYGKIGASSQEWQEGSKGKGFLDSLSKIGMVSAVPPGSFPSLFATTGITTLGMMLVVSGAWLTQFMPFALTEALPSAILLIYVLYHARMVIPEFDRHFYHTNAFYQELFLNPKSVREGREPVTCEALYWVPPRWKPAVWFSLLQLDRKQPMGRILVIAHLILWTFFYSGAGDVLINLYLFALILGKNLLVYRLIGKHFAPPLFQLQLLPPSNWIPVRFFVNLRWLPLLALSLWLISLVSARVDFDFIFYWLIVDAMLSLASAIFFTYIHELRMRKAYA